MSDENDMTDVFRDWAESRPDVVALVQIGSRVEKGSVPDSFSDYNFQLITTRPDLYAQPEWEKGLGEWWLTSTHPDVGGAQKATAVLHNGVYADFTIFSHWSVRCAFALLRLPRIIPFLPLVVADETRLLQHATRGWTVLKGGGKWQERYSRLDSLARWQPATEEQFRQWLAEYWCFSVWVTNKLARGEMHAARRVFYHDMMERAWLLLEQEARCDGLESFPEARHAEYWLPEHRIMQLRIHTPASLIGMNSAVHQLNTLVSEVAETLGSAHGWEVPRAPLLEKWLGKAPGAKEGA